MQVAPARKEKTRVYFLPHTRAAGYFKPQMESVWQSGYECFLNAVEFLEAHCLLRVLDACFIVVCLQIVNVY